MPRATPSCPAPSPPRWPRAPGGCRSIGSTAPFPGQAQKEAFVNEAFARLDALVQPAVLGERADPPPTPTPGACYLVASSATGAWNGQAGTLAVWAENQWLFALPTQGAQVYDAAAGAIAVYTAAQGWRRAAAPAAHAGGAVQDTEARAAIAAILAGLRSVAVFSE